FYRAASGAADRYLNHNASILLAPTPATTRHIVQTYPKLEDKVRVVPSGIYMDAFRPGIDGSSMRAAWNVVPHQPLLLYLGRNAYEKRIDVLLRAYARLAP